MVKKSYPLSKVYGLLEPGPVVLVTTAREGRANIMPHVMAYDDGVRAADRWLRDQQPKLTST